MITIAPGALELEEEELDEVIELELLISLELELEVVLSSDEDDELPHPVIVNDAANTEAATTLMNSFLLAINVLL